MIAINGVIITEKMRKAGSDIASDLVIAHFSNSMAGIGGCKPLDYMDFKNNPDLIRKYVEGDIDSVQAIYFAMDRAK